MDKHHIIFRSQGGLDFDLNLIELPHDYHLGDNGPHKNRETDLKLKRELQRELEMTLGEEWYTREEIQEILGLRNKDTNKLFKTLPYTAIDIEPLYNTEDIIRRLMGGRSYL